MSSVRTFVEVLAREEGWFKRKVCKGKKVCFLKVCFYVAQNPVLKQKVREAIEIKTRQPTTNRDQGFDLPIHSELLPFPRDRQTSGHSPVSSEQ